MIDEIPIEAPLFIVGVIFLATAVPAFFKLKSESGWPTFLGWVYLAVVSASCLVAFQKESASARKEAASALSEERDRERFIALLETIDRQQKIIDSGDITLLVDVSCTSDSGRCEEDHPQYIIAKPTGGQLLIEGVLEALETTEPMSRGLRSRFTTYLGQPYFYSYQEQLVSIDDLVGHSMKLYLYRLPQSYRVSSATLLTKGYNVRGTISAEKSGGRTRTAVTFKFECFSCGNPDRSDD